MGSYDSGADSASRLSASRTATAPASCPACHSASITSTAKTPNVDSYWRCDGCGEVWNISRRQSGRRGGYAWP